MPNRSTLKIAGRSWLIFARCHLASMPPTPTSRRINANSSGLNQERWSAHALGSHAETLARSGVDCRGAVCRWSADISAVFFPRLPVGLYFLGRDSGRMLGVAHAASSRGRTMGLYDPAGVGSGDS